MVWLPYLFIAITAFAINSIIFRSIMKNAKSDPYAQTVMLLGLCGFYALLIGIGSKQLLLPGITDFPYLLLGAGAAAIGSVCMYKAYKLIEASEVSILASSQRLWTVLAAFIFLGEEFSMAKIGATLIIIAGVIIASWKDKHTFRWDKGALFVLVSALLFSISDTSGYYVLRNINTITFIVFGYLLPMFLLLLFRPGIIHQLSFYKKPKNFAQIVIASIFDLIGSFAFFYAYTLGKNASLITPLLGTRVILTIILGAIILNERDNLVKKIVGASIIIAGSAFLFL